MKNELIVFRKNQIEAIAKLICPECGDGCYTCMFGKWKPCKAKAIAEKLYDEGFSRQGVGEWVVTDHIGMGKGRCTNYSTFACPICGRSNGRLKQNHCPECGARLKGGEGDG